MRRTVFTALALSTALAVPATVASAATTVPHETVLTAWSPDPLSPKDDFIRGDYRSQTSCMSALSSVRESEDIATKSSLVCKQYRSSDDDMRWGVFQQVLPPPQEQRPGQTR